ncbi:unnamed protein product [Blepharisma stoltei]|uniref:Uncharacterized protein n=1 Tax=Blepharisma stoltei TaxID=1481888 RepID=A0AAU9JBP6_9CILI|nr:unnamed protein product [Blepharisma stoltei]
MSIEFDCSWKTLTAIAVRNLPSFPSSLKLYLENEDNRFMLILQHPLSSNPTWRHFDIPRNVFPLKLKICNTKGEELYEDEIDPKHMFLAVQDINLIENFDSTACFLEFSDDGVYTTQRHAEEIAKLTQNFGIHIKLQATQEATPRDVKFGELKEQYQQLLFHRKQISELSQKISEIKQRMTRFASQKKTHNPKIKKIHEFKDFKNDLEEAAIEKRVLSKNSTGLNRFLSAQNSISHDLLGRSKINYNNNLEIAQKSLLSISNIQWMIEIRRIKLVSELYEVFKNTLVFEWLARNPEENFKVLSEEEMCFVLGHSVLLICGLSHIYRIQLRYPLKFFGSCSSIINDGIELPLHTFGKLVDNSKISTAIQCLLYNLTQVFQIAPMPHISGLENRWENKVSSD